MGGGAGECDADSMAGGIGDSASFRNGPVKHYHLMSCADEECLGPGEVAARLTSCFPLVKCDRTAAAEQAARLMSTWQRLVDAGIGHAQADKLDDLRAKWKDALLVSVAVDETHEKWFHTFACHDPKLELMFEKSVPGRRRRGIAARAASALGYELVSVDGD